MADFDYKRKTRKKPLMPWVLAVIILVIAIWLLSEYTSPDDPIPADLQEQELKQVEPEDVMPDTTDLSTP
ncbi:hypothetical protein SAMN05421823_105277 [Catalinimonas alkaloidigena]|uniref:Uncharacterized protein n=1 Tax=Catalinimonas alkaloidigena TaxID=1075417 RepID=A0A1G9JDK1_9BACT|nr:hypothetical protein [Catalinimonas alkaloidigena]SDL35286.1 hypothetical protein SAMN05421823_105277 [Catalinimonas alkaloidigena]